MRVGQFGQLSENIGPEIGNDRTFVDTVDQIRVHDTPDMRAAMGAPHLRYTRPGESEVTALIDGNVRRVSREGTCYAPSNARVAEDFGDLNYRPGATLRRSGAGARHAATRSPRVGSGRSSSRSGEAEISPLRACYRARTRRGRQSRAKSASRDRSGLSCRGCTDPSHRSW